MSYHNTSYSTPTSTRSTTSTRAKTAPPGFHYMPDGSLMADAEMPGAEIPSSDLNDDVVIDNNLEAEIIDGFNGAIASTIKNFNLDLSNLKQTGETRRFTIEASNGAMFSLEIRNTNGRYYNLGILWNLL